MEEIERAGDVAVAAAERTDRLIAALRTLDLDAVRAPSLLPDWDRLTVVCHLRYGATALLRMTRDVLAGRTTSYYPGGREQQRPATLVPAAGEGVDGVIGDWERAAAELDRAWSKAPPDAWGTPVVEPPDRTDLGPVPLARLALARLTEVDVHGTDLGIGLPDWSRTLIDVALPTRLRWMRTRRSNHLPYDASVRGSWLLASHEGRCWLVTADGPNVDVSPAAPETPATATMSGTARDLLALLLGRPPVGQLAVAGDVPFGESFNRAFPGP